MKKYVVKLNRDCIWNGTVPSIKYKRGTIITAYKYENESCFRLRKKSNPGVFTGTLFDSTCEWAIEEIEYKLMKLDLLG